jgi:hypothetical protein
MLLDIFFPSLLCYSLMKKVDCNVVRTNQLTAAYSMRSHALNKEYTLGTPVWYYGNGTVIRILSAQ